MNYVVVTLNGAGLDATNLYATEIGATFKPTTPNFDAHAAAGVRFRRYYTHPTPSAAQAAMLTGKHPYKTGVSAVTLPAVNGPPAATEPFIPLTLDATHACELVGMHKIGALDNGGFDALMKPTNGVVGFDRHFGTQGDLFGSQTYWWWPRWLTLGALPGSNSVLSDFTAEVKMIGGDDNGSPDPIGDNTGPTNRDPRNYLTTVTINDAITRHGVISGGNYVLFVCMNAPGAPLHKPPTLAERTQVGLPTRLMTATMETVTQAYEDILNGINVAANKATLAGLTPPWPTDDDELEDARDLANYLAMVEAVDTEFGRLVTAIGAAALDVTTGNTQLWVTSSHGRGA